ncbi:hypothetical protein E2C01_083587 [Portunus trituberculatus]|uniref:Cyclin-dependent kinase inhibitor domain-containing protein n=1 Tax=Portunus trituberculatus TaxID=210409 RepID=A0A5B7J258_PORTR|nr:hypothetical protein [Portunus trituberculatus]
MGRPCLEQGVAPAHRLRAPLPAPRLPGQRRAPGRGVRRLQFGAGRPDRRWNLAAAHKLLQEACLQDSLAWNFDFQADRPLPGPLAWTTAPPCPAGRIPEGAVTPGDENQAPRELQTPRETPLTPQRRLETPLTPQKTLTPRKTPLTPPQGTTTTTITCLTPPRPTGGKDTLKRRGGERQTLCTEYFRVVRRQHQCKTPSTTTTTTATTAPPPPPPPPATTACLRVMNVR